VIGSERPDAPAPPAFARPSSGSARAAALASGLALALVAGAAQALTHEPPPAPPRDWGYLG